MALNKDTTNSNK